jgi:hypothetical protein
MIRYIFLCCVSIPLYAQHTSTDFKDAVSTGPFPLYIGVGYANSFRNQDFFDVGKEFTKYYQSNKDPFTRLYGILVFTGFSYIPENAKISLGVEVKYLWLTRAMNVGDNRFELTSQQTYLGVGVRRAFFPLVVQIQGGPILNYNRTYRFDLGQEKRSINSHADAIAGWSGLLRIGILDPAGTEGGLGIYFETGFNWLTKQNDSQVSEAIRVFNDTYSGDDDSIGRYGYLSIGLLLPIAIRIKG